MNELQESAEKEKQVLIREAETAKKQLETKEKEKTDLSDRELRSMNEDLADFIQRQIGGI
jgi:hypothetical protein